MKLFKSPVFPFVLLAALTAAQSLRAGDEVVLDEFLVNATAGAVGPSAVSQGRLSLSKPVDVAEILSREKAAIAFVRKGPAAGDFLLRGLGRDEVRVSIDGCDIHGACPNRMDPPAFHVSSQQIERITVRSGPFDVEDAGTTGGSVRIDTRMPDTEFALDATGYLGSFDYVSGGISGGGKLGRMRGSGSATWQQGGVYRDGADTPFTQLAGTNFRPEFFDATAFSILQLSGKTAIATGETDEVVISAGYNRAADVLYPGLRMDAMLDESWRASVEYSHAMDSELVSRLNFEVHFSGVWHDMRDTYRLTSANPMWEMRGFMMRSQAWSSTAQFRVRSEGTWSGGALRMGVNYDERRWDINNHIMAFTNDMLPDVLSRQLGAYLSNTWERDGWSLETGLRLDRAESKARGEVAFLQAAHGTTTNRNSDLLPSAYVLAQREVGPMRVYLGLGHGERTPDPQERYLNLNRPMMNPDWVGDPDLKPVKSTEFQGGVATVLGDWTVHGSMFHAWLNDFVYLARLSPVDGSGANANSRTFANVDARLYGADLDATWDVNESWSAEIGAALQRGTRDGLLPGGPSEILGEIPETSLRAAINWTPGSWTVRLALHGAFSQGRVDAAIQETPVGGWTSVDALISRRFAASWEATLGCENLLDADYRLHNAYTRDPFASGAIVREPGRFVYLRVSWVR